MGSLNDRVDLLDGSHGGIGGIGDVRTEAFELAAGLVLGVLPVEARPAGIGGTRGLRL
jgi:hypothetical protein